MTTQEYTGTLVVVSCAACVMDFGIPRRLYQKRREDHGSFWCPAGHSNYWPQQNEAEALTEQLAAARRIAANERELRQSAERQRAAARGQVTKMRRRVGRGVCPSCHRTFPNLADHMSCKHPEYAEAQA